MVNGVEVPMTPQEIAERQAEEAAWEAGAIERQNAEAEKSRQAAYVSESDPLFFKAQRGESTMEEWQAKVAEIKARYPKIESAESQDLTPKE